jgi:hypothetical protein
MWKIVEIEECKECKNCVLLFNEDFRSYEHCCTNMDTPRVIWNVLNIPIWCPLPNAQEGAHCEDKA